MPTYPTPPLKLARPDRPAMRAALVLILVASADSLFVGHRIGISLSVFLGLLALAALAGNRLLATRDEIVVAGAALVVGLMPTVETFGLLHLLFGVAGVAVFTLAITGRLRVPWPNILRRVATLMVMNTCTRLRRIAGGSLARRVARWRGFLGALSGWLVPVALGTFFTVLFSIANPVFLSWIEVLDLRWMLVDLQPARYAFWILVAFCVAPFVRVPAFGSPRRVALHPLPLRVRPIGEPLVLRSLIVVNLVFALQTTLDVAYLWSGAELPEGVTPAEDAQKAAYILVISALLAAILVLLAVPRADARDDRESRTRSGLLQLWIAQNVVLVLSAVLRLALYVESYALTELRVAAFIWMGLVVTGLVLIEWRIAFARSSGWLVKANLATVFVVLYGCALLDVAAITARYNVDHSRELSGRGVLLDRDYLCSLGLSALPAIERFMARQESQSDINPDATLHGCAAKFRLTLMRKTPDWREWNFRDHRLRQSIQQSAEKRGRPDDAADDPRRR